jgi:glutamyl-tRNA synthetase
MLEKMLDLYQPRSRTFVEMAENCRFFFTDELTYDTKAVDKFLKKEPGESVLVDLKDRFAAMPAWEPMAIEKVIEDYCTEKQLGMGKVAQPIRVAVTGSSVSPSVHETLEVLGREKTLARMQKAIELIRQG